MGHTVENNLKERIYVYEQNPQNKSWKCEKKIKRIYKYVNRNKLPKHWKGTVTETNVRTLKKDTK